MIVEFKEAKGHPLVPGNIYKAGPGSSFAADPISNIFPKLGNQSGFRKKLCENRHGRTIKDDWAYIALQSTGGVSEWPDKLDEDTGIFTYYGDQPNRSKDIFDTKQKGNTLLKNVFDWLHSGEYEKIPPFFIFQSLGDRSRDTKFLGLAVPGNPTIPFGQDLVLATDSFGNTINNYLAHFTLLNITDSEITYDWLLARITDKSGSNELAPKAWRDFVALGMAGITKNESDDSIVNAIDYEINYTTLEGKTKQALVETRVNQSVFRKRLLERYNKCCLCNVHDPVLLTASHIKPWAKCEPDEKLNVDNGFLLCPNHDSLFDAGYISFDDKGKIIISNKMDESDRTAMNVYDNMKITLTPDNKKYLRYHRKYIFKNE